MKKQVNKVGRPSEDKNNRTQLILAARLLFVEYDYDKVSLRSIAKKAQVDSGLIRYYFQSKLGLFIEMVKETAAPVTAQLEKAEQQISVKSSEMLMKTYYRVMSDNPDFPKLIFKIVSMPSSDKNISLQKILDQTLNLKSMNIFSSMQEDGLLKEGTDPLCAQMSFFSMMVFPFLMPDVIKQAMGIDFNAEFIAKLGEQNTQLLQHGCLAVMKNERNTHDKQ